jgi:hypothetical protein
LLPAWDVLNIDLLIDMKPRWTRRNAALAVLLLMLINAVPCQSQPYPVATQKKGSPQGLWVSNSGFFDEFQGGSIEKNGRPHPALGLTFAECCPSFQALTFDKSRNLWVGFVADQGSGVGELKRNELNTSNRRLLFHVTLSYDEDPNPLFSPRSLAFDPAGDLWVTDNYPLNLYEYTPDQLATSGGPTPASTITFPNGSGIVPALILFDSAGDLWLTDQFSVSDSTIAVVEYTPAQIAELQMGTLPTPTLTVVAGPQSDGLSAITFDKSGNLWIAAPATEYGAGLVYGGLLEMFQVAGKTGTLSQPDVVITPSAISSTNQTNQSMDRPFGLAFDDQGGLWVSSNISDGRDDTGFIVKFAAKQLTTSGSPVPPIVLTPNRKADNLQWPSPIVIGPTVE